MPFLIVRDLNFIRLMSLSSAPILRKLSRMLSMRLGRAVVESLLDDRLVSSSSSGALTSSSTMRESRPAFSRSFRISSSTIGIVGEGLVDLRLALLDAFGDADLALAVEQLDRAHLAQVHAHRVVGLLDGVAGLVGGLRGLGGAAPRGPVRIGDDLDADLEETGVDPLRDPGARRSPRPRGSCGSPRRGCSPSPGRPSAEPRPRGTCPQSPSSFPFHRGARPSAAFRRITSCFRRISPARSSDPSPARSIAL